jgi:hypothetical protein
MALPVFLGSPTRGFVIRRFSFFPFVIFFNFLYHGSISLDWGHAQKWEGNGMEFAALCFFFDSFSIHFRFDLETSRFDLGGDNNCLGFGWQPFSLDGSLSFLRMSLGIE